MTGLLSGKDYKEGLIAGCIVLYESYGHNFIDETINFDEEPHFSISPFFSSDNEEISEEEKEEEKKQEALRQKELEEQKRQKEEYLKNKLEKGKEQSSYKPLKSLEAIDSKKLDLRNRLIGSRWSGYGIIDKLLKIIRDVTRNKQPNAGVFLNVKYPVLLAPTFSEMLVDFMQKKGLDSKDVYEAANIDRRLFSKILSDTYYQPSKETAIYLCLALHLNIDEAEDFLATAGYALSRSKISNVVVEYFIRTGNYSVEELEEIVNEIQKLAENHFGY